MRIKGRIPVLGVVFLILTAMLCPSTEAFAKKNDISLKRTTKIIFLGGCRGKKKDGSAAKYSKQINAKNLLKGFDADKMTLTLKSRDNKTASVSNKKQKIYAQGIGSTEVMLTVCSKKTGKQLFAGEVTVQVRKNAGAEDLQVLGVEEGDTFTVGESINVLLPNYSMASGNIISDTDLRRLKCDSDEVFITKGSQANSYFVQFDGPGEYTLVAEAYQSSKYSGATVTKKITVSVEEKENRVWQTGTRTFCLEGDAVYDDLEPAEIGVYEALMDIDMFYTNVDDITVKDGIAYISVFRQFEGGKEYIIKTDGEEYRFTAAETGPEAVASMDFRLEEIYAGCLTNIGFNFYDKDGIDITENVSETLLSHVGLEVGGDTEGIFFSTERIYVPNAGARVVLKAQLTYEALADKVIAAEKEFVTKPVNAVSYTGKYKYTFVQDDGKYLQPGEEERHSAAFGDSVVLEALLLYSDGSYRTLQEAGVDGLRIENEYIAMKGGKVFQAASGGTALTFNNEGATYILAMKGEEVVERFRLDVTGARKAASLQASVSKDKLNSNLYAEDYLIIKAQVLDQYGDVFTTDGFTITQPKENMASAGVVDFGVFREGRMLLYGSDCHMTGSNPTITAVVSWKNLSQTISFDAQDVDFYPERISEYSIQLKTEDELFLNTGLAVQEETKTVFVTAEITRDGYLVGELEDFGYGFAELLEEPSIGKPAGEYGLETGEDMFGLLIKFTSDSGGVIRYLEATDCICNAYGGIEFFPFLPGKRLELGKYELSLYYIKGGEKISQVEKCGGMLTIRTYDGTPDIIYDQIAESAVVEETAPWTKNIKKFFRFYLDGEEITDYVTNVDCSESAAGSVYVRSVSFGLTNPDYGTFTETCNVDVLIARQ